MNTTTKPWYTTNDKVMAAGASTRSSHFELQTETVAEPSAGVSLALPMVDPYRPAAGRDALAAYRAKVGRQLTEEIKADVEETARLNEAVRDIADGNLRPLPLDT